MPLEAGDITVLAKAIRNLQEPAQATPRPRDRLPQAELTSQVNYSKW